MPEPPHLVFDCEVLTPLFLAGADPDSAELRAPSIRGALRYWYRALLGGRGYSDVALACAESEVFGSAGMGGVKASASAVEVLVRMKDNSQVVRAKTSDHLRIGSGTGYLWYSMRLGNNNRGFYQKGTGFRVALVAPRGDKTALIRAGAAFWLLAHLGGLGSRSRRGAGSFYVQKVRASPNELLDSLPKFTEEAENPKKLADILTTGLKSVAALIHPTGNPRSQNFDVLADKWTSVVVAGYKNNDPLQAALSFGAELQKFRSGSTGYKNKNVPRPEMAAENTAIKGFLANRRMQPGTVFKRPGFGLPYSVQYKGGPTVQFTAAHPDAKRRASPMLVHVARGSDKYYDIVLTTFNSRFLPDGLDGLLVDGRTPVTLGRGIIKEFRMKVLNKNGITVEVPA